MKNSMGKVHWRIWAYYCVGLTAFVMAWVLSENTTTWLSLMLIGLLFIILIHLENNNEE